MNLNVTSLDTIYKVVYMKLVIVESPAKCSTIEGYLGKEYKCIASFGHIRELSDLSCIDKQDNYRLTFKDSDSKTKQIQKIRGLIKKADEVIIATDDDREGEGIGWHLCQVFSLNPETTSRIIFNEITKPALQWAINNPTRLDMNKVNAQLSRQTLDMLVGYQLSPVLWKHISRNKGLSAGRCQSPALRLLYENQQEIDSNIGENIYNVTGMFTSRCITFSLDNEIKEYNTVSKFLEDSVNHEHIYSCNKPRNVTKNPPQPFTTSALQQTASTNLNMSPKDTMKRAQKLYEAGYITYMRTDSKTYSKDFIETVKPYVKEKYGEEYISKVIDELSVRKEEVKKKKKGKKGEEDESKAQEAHEAIRPTLITREEIDNDMEPRDKKLYNLIWRTTLESCMEAAKYSSVTSIITAAKDNKYRYSTEQAVFPGWKIVGGYEKENKEYLYLQTIKKDSIVDYRKVVSKVSMKDLKTHYTEAKLVQLLEQKGIGRPSTFSSLIEKIQEREYVKKQDVKGKKLKCTDYELTEDTITENST